MKGDFDVVIIGSGFGGSVSALRLVEKGYRVAVLEAGRRFSDLDFPKTSWRIRKFLFAPGMGLFGIQRIHFLPNVIVLAGAGVGGCSLVYANTLYQPGDQYFSDPQWARIADWKSELEPCNELARRMLGVKINPFFSPSDQEMKDAAQAMGVGETFTMAPLGIHFGSHPGAKAKDAFFGGVGPERDGCIQCGACMTGCRHNAKNTLPKNYLGLAESAGTFNTQKLLHRMKDKGTLAKLSEKLGDLSRTNSESLVGAVMPNTDIDFSTGSAITSSFYPDPRTHIEPVRYGKGSNLMGLLQTLMTDGATAKEAADNGYNLCYVNLRY